MPSLMPSLAKYFTIVGAILFAGLMGLNSLLDPSGPGARLVKKTPDKIVVQVDPHASKVERLRAEEAALKAAEKANPHAHPVVVTEPLRLPPQPVPPLPEQPVVQAAATPAVQSAPAALATEPERPAHVAQEEAKQKAAAEKARKKRIARERARTRAIQEASAARQQEETTYSYAPRPAYGPFGQQAQGGFGGGWGSAWGRTW